MVFFLFSCSSDEADESPLNTTDGSEYFSSDSASSSSSPGSPSSGPASGNGDGEQTEAGLVTAAEWNDLDNWTFWSDLLKTETFANKPEYWKFHTKNRMSVLVKNDSNEPIEDIPVRLEKDGALVWEAKTDNFGKAELFFGLRQNQENVDLTQHSVFVGDQAITSPLKLFTDGINEFVTTNVGAASNKVELAFVVDATGSMSDELEFLKKDLLDVIDKVKNDAPNLNVLTSTVFYRDQGDEYVVKHSGFSTDTQVTLDFIKQQVADGGGDFPEAVHTALNSMLNELQWSNSSKTRIAFLLLDAPPHNNTAIIGQLQDQIESAAKKGIKLIPITASGIDQETEYLMRAFSIATNGTYVFITNDSGIGGDHLEASVGEYQVEKLNDLMVRLISKYSE
jgi:hypothetical protein